MAYSTDASCQPNLAANKVEPETALTWLAEAQRRWLRPLVWPLSGHFLGVHPRIRSRTATLKLEPHQLQAPAQDKEGGITNGNVLYMPYYFDKSGNMESEQAILSFAALAQPTRLEVFRLLVRAEPKGISAGELAKSLAVPANTLSSHLNVMTRAGLVRGERHSRTIIYRARVDELRALIGFLLKDCCDGRPDICAPILDDISCCTKATCP